MIILASDYVGLRVVEFVASREERVLFVVLDDKDKGSFNHQIEHVCSTELKETSVVTSSLLRDPGFLDRVSSANPRLGILAWWPNILEGKILDIPRSGWLNFHPSYLPFNRGKHPNFWGLVDNTPCGVTLHYLGETIDGGDIVAQEALEVSWEDTGETVYKRSRELTLDLFKKNFDKIIADSLPRKPQDPDLGNFHKAKEIDAASRIHMDSKYTARNLLNIIRARMFPSHPTAYFYDNGKKYSLEVVIKEIGTETDG